MEKNKNKSEPIICGIDIGSWTIKISYYDGEKFETLVNEANFRQTPSLVAFTPLERMIGEPANIKLKSNFKNTIRSPMRHIGLGKNAHMIEEELKHCTFQYDLEEGVRYLVQHNGENLSLSPEQCLMALMAKIKEIVDVNNFHLYASFIAIPSYLSNSERSTIRRCAQLQKMGQVYLLEDWIAVASEYSYFRIKDLYAMQEPERNVIFIDVGYSKFSIYAVRFTAGQSELLDFEHLKYTGSKNMDNHLTQFYDELFREQNGEGAHLLSNPKALVKLKENIEKQRKVLSANSEHHLSIEYLLGECDLSYNMKRPQFEDLITPAVSEIASALSNIKSRLLHKVPVHSVELIGGASRIPMLQQIISEILCTEPSRTMNSAESMSRGAAIYGAIETGFLSSVQYQIQQTNFVAVSVAWNHVKNDKFLGENPADYPHKKVIFDWGCSYPCEQVLNFGPEGVVEIFVHYEHEIASQSIGYMRVNTPNKVVFVFDRDKIISAKCKVGGFLIYNFHEIKEERWQKMEKLEHEFQENDRRILTLYHVKNEYESLTYKVKDKIQNEWKQFTNPTEQKQIMAAVLEAEKWIAVESEKPIQQLALKEYTSRMEALNKITEGINPRKRNFDEIDPLYREFLQRAELLNAKLITNSGKQELQSIVGRAMEDYQSMASNLYETKMLTANEINNYSRQISRLQ